MAVLDLDATQKGLVAEIRAHLSQRLPVLERMDERDEFPTDLAEWMWDRSLLTLALPRAHGGGGSVKSLCAVVEELARFSGGLSLLCVAQATGALAVALGASPEQQERCFRSIRNRQLVAFALSETRAGSDASSIATKIVDRGDHYEVNGSKWFVTNGGVARHYVIFGRHILEGVEVGHSAVLIDRDTPGFAVAPKNDLFGMRGTPTTSILMKKVQVPKERLLGRVGEGFKLAMRTLDRSRPLIGAQAVGLAQAALDISVKHSLKRVVFDRPLGNLDGVRLMLADMAVAVDASRLLVYRAAEAVDAGDPDATQYSAGAKFFATDTAMKVAADAIQILGGYGCFRGRTLDRIMRDAKITQIYEGANQIQRLVVARQILKSARRAAGSAEPRREATRSERPRPKLVPLEVER